MKVIWATDGSGNADAALLFARELAGTGGSLIAVYCLYGTPAASSVLVVRSHDAR